MCLVLLVTLTKGTTMGVIQAQEGETMFPLHHCQIMVIRASHLRHQLPSLGMGL